MKSFGILSTLFLTATAAPLAPRQEAIQTTNFSAATVQGGPGASYVTLRNGFLPSDLIYSL